MPVRKASQTGNGCRCFIEETPMAYLAAAHGLWQDSKLKPFHRDEGPAYEAGNGYKGWWKDGRRHRPDGPAREFPSGYREWWEHGLKHRLDGPAVENSDGSVEWWVSGRKMNSDDFVIAKSEFVTLGMRILQ